jgi:Na+-driven multidrug efflux pump
MLGMFTKDTALIADGVGVLQMVNLAMIFFSAAIVFISGVSGTGATTTALIIEIAAIIIYLVYIYVVVFPLHASLEIAWLAETIYWIITGVLCYGYLQGEKWKKISI